MTSLGSVPDGVHLALDDSDSKFMPPKKTTIEAVAPSHVTVFPNRHFPFPFTAPRMGDLPFSCLPPTAWESSAWEPTGFQCRSPPPNPWLPPHATNTPSDGTCKQHVNHLETAATLIPRHHHQHRNLCCGQLLRQQTRHQGDLENCLVLFTHIENHGDGTRTPTNPKAGPGGGGCGLLGKKASVPRVFSLISFILVSVWTAADRRAVFRDHWMWWQSRAWAGPGMASRAPS